MSNHEFAFYDFECSGLSYMYDRPVQFAGMRTDAKFNVISDPIDIKCRLPEDVIMNPHAALVHGLTPQALESSGLDEPEFAERISHFFSKRGTTLLGYNTENYDKHFTRHMLYRCMLPPYDFEWRNGNSRWDVLSLVRAVYSVNRNALNWPSNGEGKVTFKLAEICQANGISNEGAHDALCDIRMTIDLLRLVSESAPEWTDFFFKNKGRREVAELIGLEKPLKKRFVVHSDYTYGSSTCYVAPLVPICPSPLDRNKVICVDLRGNVDELINLSPQQLSELLYTKKEDLPIGVERPPIATITINSCPTLIPATHFKDDKFEINNLDKDHCQKQFRRLLELKNIEGTLSEVFRYSNENIEIDVEGQLYFGQGFIPKTDLDCINNARQQGEEVLTKASIYLTDRRMKDLLFRYRARYLPGTLSENERLLWNKYLKTKLSSGPYSLANYWQDLATVADNISGTATEREKKIIEDLSSYGSMLDRKLSALAGI